MLQVQLHKEPQKNLTGTLLGGRFFFLAGVEGRGGEEVL